MPAPPSPRVYVSSTYEDLKEYRQVASVVLQRLGFIEVGLRYYSARAERSIQRALKDLETCELYIAILGWRYGDVPTRDNPEGLSVTELEYRRAVELKIPQVIVLVDTGRPQPPTPDQWRAANFRLSLERNHLVLKSTSLDSFEEELFRALMQWINGPPLPVRFVPPSPQTVALIQSLADSPERIARLLASIVLADRTRLALLESPNTAGIADALSSHDAQNAEGVATLIGRMDGEHFDPDPLWLAWITNIHRERLAEIGSEILRVSGLLSEAG